MWTDVITISGKKCSKENYRRDRMYLVKTIKTFCDSQAPVEESLRQIGTTFKVASKERLNVLLKAGVVEIVEEPVKEEISEPKEEEIVKPKSYNGGRKNGRKQSTKLGRKNS